MSTDVREIDLAVEGMTCASCVARVEKKLNRVPGVQATVNLALESAHVLVAAPEDGTAPADEDALVAAVRAAGYDARVVRPRYAAHDEHMPEDHTAMSGHDHAHMTEREAEEMALSGMSHAGMEHDEAEDTSAPTDTRGTDLRRRLWVA